MSEIIVCIEAFVELPVAVVGVVFVVKPADAMKWFSCTCAQSINKGKTNAEPVFVFAGDVDVMLFDLLNYFFYLLFDLLCCCAKYLSIGVDENIRVP